MLPSRREGELVLWNPCSALPGRRGELLHLFFSAPGHFRLLVAQADVLALARQRPLPARSGRPGLIETKPNLALIEVPVDTPSQRELPAP